jgi:hypothetical protein
MSKRLLSTVERESQIGIYPHGRDLRRIDIENDRATGATPFHPPQELYQQLTSDSSIPPLGPSPHSPNVRRSFRGEGAHHPDELAGRAHCNERGITVPGGTVPTPLFPLLRGVGGFPDQRAPEGHGVGFQRVKP